MFSLLLNETKYLHEQINLLAGEKLISQIIIICNSSGPNKTILDAIQKSIPGCMVDIIISENNIDFETLVSIIDKAANRYIIFLQSAKLIKFNYNGLIRFKEQLEINSTAGLIYSDYIEVGRDDTEYYHHVSDYQFGSVRDDFDFGNILIVPKDKANQAVSLYHIPEITNSALYDLRLKLSLISPIIRVKEPLYSAFPIPEKKLKSYQELFKYVDPSNLSYQKELEAVFTGYLKHEGAWLARHDSKVNIDAQKFDIEASIIIPVKNREKTIEDALRSALNQETDYLMNVIVVDNHSTDKTSAIIDELSLIDRRIVHIIPEITGLNIGGCWDYAVHNKYCGRFAIQLDSDDLFSSTNVVDHIVDTFREKRTAMVIGSYELVDFCLNPIPPGMIDHREWSDDNGHNNCLRINGLGAPRAFYVPVIRDEFRFPNVSYAEDYAVILGITRKYPIARIFDSLYYCRRWDQNTDSSLTFEQERQFNEYKDWLRTCEMTARKKLLQAKES